MALTSDSCMLNSKDWLGRDQAGIHHWPWVAGKALRQTGRGKIAGVNTTNHWAWSNITATSSAAPWEYSFPLLDVPCFHSIIRGISCLKSYLLPGIKELVLLPTVPTKIWALYVCNLPVIENGNSCSNRYKDWIQQTSYFSGFYLFLNTFFFKRVSLCGLAEDFKEHARLCDQLLGHYSAQYDDRRVYWAARNRSTYQKDLLCIIIDSFDRSKLCLPSYPFGRCPKRTVYEFFSRHLAVHLCIENSYISFQMPPWCLHGFQDTWFLASLSDARKSIFESP